MRPHYSHSSRENATPSSGTSPLGSCKGVPPPGNQSHNFITLIFVRSSLSSLLLFRVDGQKQSEAAMFGRSVFFGLKTEEKNLRFQTKTDTCVVYGLLKFPHLPSPGNDIIQALLPGTYFRLSENPAELHEMCTFRR